MKRIAVVIMVLLLGGPGLGSAATTKPAERTVKSERSRDHKYEVRLVRKAQPHDSKIVHVRAANASEAADAAREANEGYNVSTTRQED